jgi:hypothetical protein
MSRPKSPFLWFIVIVLAIAVLTVLGPEEKSLGANARIVYLHGAWVLTALVAFIAAGFMGLTGLLTRRLGAHLWSQALARTAIVFWITYLPLSLWAMQTNWNGLFLAEPRFRVAIIYAAAGFGLQIGLSLINRPAWTSLVNLAFAVALVYVLETTGNVLHPPPSPIFGSGIASIEIFFILMNLLTLFAAYQLTRWWLSR